MTTTLNASTAGAGGFIATSDNSGVLALQTGGTTAITIDASQNSLYQIQTTPPTLTVNGQMVMNLTSNTNLRISVRGSDGTTRVANITLA